MHLPVVAAVIVILVSGFVIFKNSAFGPQPTSDKGFQATMINEASASVAPSVSVKPSVKPSATAKAAVSPTPGASQSSSGSSNNNSSGNSNDSGNSNSTSSTTPSATPAPSQSSTPSCSGLCFDRGSALVEVTQGANVENGGSTATAFNLIGDGENGFIVNVSGLPDGFALTPSSGGFAANSTQQVKVWIHTNNTSYGTHNGTVTLRKNMGGGVYSEVGTMSITVTYKSS